MCMHACMQQQQVRTAKDGHYEDSALQTEYFAIGTGFAIFSVGLPTRTHAPGNYASPPAAQQQLDKCGPELRGNGRVH